MSEQEGSKVAHALGQVTDTIGGVVGKLGAAMTRSADGFVGAAAMSDLYEITAAKIALERATSPKVREAAQMMIEDHSKLARALEDALHTPETEGVMGPAEHLDGRHEAMIAHLRHAPADAFDATYVDQQVLAHEEAVTLMHHYCDHGGNGRLRQVAAEASPVIERHLAHVKALRRQL